ncbi:PREDICTED: C-X-C chemokine receptor type 2-like [Nanorana parkeri]|uniref:C-X-C chemokine receptor type 2-like n=1 Tax=Nanorana parkeri TaxID=125878 RepID=UPI00085464E3|nr:PREDICTED: C-X-C chemokine receptor type 2-like [Nanorana parkeri]
MANSINVDLEGIEDYSLDTSAPYYPSSDAAPCQPLEDVNRYIYVVVYSIVFLLNIVGNTLVIVVIRHNKLKRSSTDFYLLNLAIADLLFAFTLPFWAAYKAHEWIFGVTMCKLVCILQEVNFYSGILLLACISVDRYLAIVRATESVTQKRHLVKHITAAIWIFSFAISFPTILFKTVFKTPKHGLVCHEDIGAENTVHWKIIITIGRQLAGFFIPLIIMLFCYGFTIKTLFQTKNNQKQRAMMVIFAVVLVFLVCWLPYNITVIVDSLMRTGYINETCDFRNKLDVALPVTEIFGYSHSCINPILYAFIGQKFRRSFLRILASKGIIRKENLPHFVRSSSVMSTSGNTSTTI